MVFLTYGMLVINGLDISKYLLLENRRSRSRPRLDDCGHCQEHCYKYDHLVYAAQRLLTARIESDNFKTKFELAIGT